jgi:ferredoxin
MPYPTKGFDLAMAPVDNGYLIEVGSEKGRKLIEDHARYFTVAQEGHINTRLRHRDELVERLKRHLAPQKLVAREEVQKIVKEGYTCDIWHEYMQTCVECGGCNLICDTCHCFLLADKPQDFSPAGQVQGKRTRMWDSCLYANYARVAGGANPLKLRAQRLRNRFMKKFDFFVEVLAMPACCGCGRCIEVCPGKIDIREVLKSLGEHHRALQHKETE